NDVLPLNWSTNITSFGGYYTLDTYQNQNRFYAMRSSNTSSDVAFGGKLGASESEKTLTFTVINNTENPINGFVVTWNVEQYSVGGRQTVVDLIHSFGGVTTGNTEVV